MDNDSIIQTHFRQNFIFCLKTYGFISCQIPWFSWTWISWSSFLSSQPSVECLAIRCVRSYPSVHDCNLSPLCHEEAHVCKSHPMCPWPAGNGVWHGRNCKAAIPIPLLLYPKLWDHFPQKHVSNWCFKVRIGKSLEVFEIFLVCMPKHGESGKMKRCIQDCMWWTSKISIYYLFSHCVTRSQTC